MQHVVHPGPCPPGWAALAGVTLAVIGIALAIIIGAGVIEGRPAKHFAEARAGTFLSTLLLLVCASLCAAIAVEAQDPSMRRFWTVAALGFLFLTYDELAMAHENLSKHLHLALGWDRTRPLSKRLDDVVVLLYGVAAAAWGFRYRRDLVRLRWATSLAALAGVAFVLTVAADLVRGWQATEETFKIVSEALIVVALLAARIESPAVNRVTGQVRECVTDRRLPIPRLVAGTGKLGDDA